jgi:hypothetical protein
MTSTEPRRLLVLTGPSDRTFAISELPTGVRVVDDLDGAGRLGEAIADLTPFEVVIGDAPYVIFAGPQERSEHRFTVIDGHPYPVRNGVWMSFPEPFVPGMQVTAVWQGKRERELFRLTSPPLHPGSLQPMFGPSWTGYSPLG